MFVGVHRKACSAEAEKNLKCHKSDKLAHLQVSAKPQKSKESDTVRVRDTNSDV